MKNRNIMLAEFIGWKHCGCGKGKPHLKYGEENWEIIYVSDLDFHKNWNTLTLVAKKCIRSHHDHRQDIFSALHKLNRKQLWSACCDFVEKYNNGLLDYNK